MVTKSFPVTADAFIASSGSLHTAVPDTDEVYVVVSSIRTADDPGLSGEFKRLYRQNPFDETWTLLTTEGASFVYIDRSAPLNVAFKYRMEDWRFNAIDASIEITTTLVKDGWFLSSDTVDPFEITVTAAEHTRQRQQEPFMVLGQRFKDIQSGHLLGAAGTLSISVEGTVTE